MLYSLPFVSVLAILLGTSPCSVMAQSLSAADILSKVEETAGGMNEYQALLNDPDPNRSLAAMEIMLGSGDVKLMRMALDHGIYSPDPVMQRTALQGFFDSAPILKIYASGENSSKDKGFKRDIENDLSGTVDSGGVGFFTVSVGPYIPDWKCYSFLVNTADCFIALSDSGILIKILGKKGALKMADDGELLGEIKFPHSEASSIIRIPVSY
jgi:hypothetical protein